MNKRDIILVVVMLGCFVASGFILYNNFAAPAGYLPNRGYQLIDSNVSSGNVKILESQVDSSMVGLGADGWIKQLNEQEQYLKLSDEAIKPIIIGKYGARTNPFLPIDYSTYQPAATPAATTTQP